MTPTAVRHGEPTPRFGPGRLGFVFLLGIRSATLVAAATPLAPYEHRQSLDALQGSPKPKPRRKPSTNQGKPRGTRLSSPSILCRAPRLARATCFTPVSPDQSTAWVAATRPVGHGSLSAAGPLSQRASDVLGRVLSRRLRVQIVSESDGPARTPDNVPDALHRARTKLQLSGGICFTPGLSGRARLYRRPDPPLVRDEILGCVERNPGFLRSFTVPGPN